ncbi:hypothetical protein DENIS_0840 [Desulfonema ishimotonii]|uniref:DUF615 domain-containing protein n=1 Tax=Desulfonema ishimotonii TaxID=45657 RepID=A0A401FSG4_9BACT|nr:ribosome biogenesis factor YjgA [Desulfonema ishimotonii]GBC59898.1 hypothetical protein DENIS_0840 [Desulfonema ishimotonii]
MTENEIQEEEYGEERKSRSQIKREVQALQKMGEQLVTLSKDQLNAIDMAPELREAVLFAKKSKKHEAVRRQMQRIGAIMREVDPEPVRKALEDIAGGKHQDALRFKQVEGWRDQILAGDDALLEELTGQFQDADRQKLRQLARNARKEKAAEKPPKSSRALFRYLMELAKSAL